MKDYPRSYIVDTSHSPFALLRPVPVQAVRLEDDFWAPRLETLRKVTLPSQYRICEETGRLFNFRRAAGKEKGDFQGYFFNDSDVYKWIEAVAFALAYEQDEKLWNLAQGLIEDIVAAQDPEGYLNTYFTFEKREKRWTNLRDMHELYCAGHLFQAAIAYYRATKERKLLEASCRFADYISEVFGPGRRPGTCGHPEIEMALVELFRTTGKKSYLDLAQFFLDERGRGILGGSPYFIDHKPFRDLTEIVGHAVRSLYLNCGATDLYMETGEKEIWEALLRLWKSMAFHKIYVTGGVGSRREGEAFGAEYELPSAQAYAETCAAIANVMWNWRMLLASGNGAFADMMELALYNGALSGISLDGLGYFYVNPLADRGMHRRQTWFPCACCPPNIARLLASIPGYFYSISKDGVWVHLYARSTAHLLFEDMPLTIIQRTEYPWKGLVELILKPWDERLFSLYLRIPGWCRQPGLRINGAPAEAPLIPGSYVELRRTWKDGDKIRLSLPMPVQRILCNPMVSENADRVALKRGPIVYCLEQADNPGVDVWNIVLPEDTRLSCHYEPNLLKGVSVLRGRALALEEDFGERLYLSSEEVSMKWVPVNLTAIPYYAWANRDPGPMTVWIRYARRFPWRLLPAKEGSSTKGFKNKGHNS